MEIFFGKISFVQMISFDNIAYLSLEDQGWIFVFWKQKDIIIFYWNKKQKVLKKIYRQLFPVLSSHPKLLTIVLFF